MANEPIDLSRAEVRELWMIQRYVNRIKEFRSIIRRQSEMIVTLGNDHYNLYVQPQKHKNVKTR